MSSFGRCTQKYLGETTVCSVEILNLGLWSAERSMDELKLYVKITCIFLGGELIDLSGSQRVLWPK